jgi:hypothetical protein
VDKVDEVDEVDEKTLTLALGKLILICRMPNLKLSKKRLILALSSSLVLIIASGAMVTVFTAVTYARSCSKLTGFPGLLQRVGIVSLGPCVSKIGGTVCGGGTACTTAGSKAGTCKNVAAAGQPASCQCVENTVSKGLQ